MVGMATVLGRYDIAFRSSFLLVLQLVGINLSAALIFRAFGLSSKGARYTRGKSWLFPVFLGGTAAFLVGLLSLQFAMPPSLERSSLEQKATATVQTVVRDYEAVNYIDADVRFTQTPDIGTNTLLALVYVQARSPSLSTTEIQETLRANLRAELNAAIANTEPLIMVNVLSP
jgi:uncharacterized membrane protein